MDESKEETCVQKPHFYCCNIPFDLESKIRNCRTSTSQLRHKRRLTQLRHKVEGHAPRLPSKRARERERFSKFKHGERENRRPRLKFTENENDKPSRECVHACAANATLLTSSTRLHCSIQPSSPSKAFPQLA